MAGMDKLMAALRDLREDYEDPDPPTKYVPDPWHKEKAIGSEHDWRLELVLRAFDEVHAATARSIAAS